MSVKGADVACFKVHFSYSSGGTEENRRLYFTIVGGPGGDSMRYR